MKVKDIIDKIGELDAKDLELIIECVAILSNLEKEEVDKLMELLDLMKKKQEERIRKEIEEEGRL